MAEFDDFIAECNRAPRLNALSEFFALIAAGRSGMPMKKPGVDRRLLPLDDLQSSFIELHAARQGFFDQHYHGSIPYRLEEECRMGLALLRYARRRATPISLYSLGTAEGTMARTLSELSRGRISSLSCSPNSENYDCFMAYGEPPDAAFFLGPFHALTPERLGADPRYGSFHSGFDVILEDTTFQMYSPNRMAQIAFVSRHLKKDGIFLFVEKFRAADKAEYERRELQKDHGFKPRYFSASDVQRKKRDVLKTMHDNEVSLDAMSDAVFAHFAYCRMVWNSGNFYGLAASNSLDNLSLYLSAMPTPAIPSEYVYEPAIQLEAQSWSAPSIIEHR